MGKNSSAILVLVVAVAIIATMALGSTGPGEAAVGLTVFYEDGSKKVVEPHKGFFGSFLGMKITDSTGKAVSSVEYRVEVKAVYTGSPNSVSYTGSNILIAVDMNTKTSQGATAFSGMPPNGQWVTVASGTITASQLEGWALSYGNHQLNIAPQVLMKLTWPDGTTINKEASMISLWLFTYEADGTFTGLSIQVAHTPLS